MSKSTITIGQTELGDMRTDQILQTAKLLLEILDTKKVLRTRRVEEPIHRQYLFTDHEGEIVIADCIPPEPLEILLHVAMLKITFDRGVRNVMCATREQIVADALCRIAKVAIPDMSVLCTKLNT